MANLGVFRERVEEMGFENRVFERAIDGVPRSEMASLLNLLTTS